MENFIFCAVIVLFGITVDDELNFKKHFKSLCHTAPQKLNPLIRLRRYLTLEKSGILETNFKNFILTLDFLFGYFLEKPHTSKQTKYTYCTLKVIYQSNASYQVLLERSSTVSRLQKQSWFLLTHYNSVLLVIPPENTKAFRFSYVFKGVDKQQRAVMGQ